MLYSVSKKTFARALANKVPKILTTKLTDTIDIIPATEYCMASILFFAPIELPIFEVKIIPNDSPN